jgi:hypothetical protein
MIYRKQNVQANGKATEAGLVFDNYFAIFIIMVIDWFAGFASLVIFMVLHFLIDFGKVSTDFFEERKGQSELTIFLINIVIKNVVIVGANMKDHNTMTYDI